MSEIFLWYPKTLGKMIAMISIEEKTYVRIVGDVGQSLYVTIPHDIRVKEGIEKGDELEIRSIDGKIVMEKKEDET